MALLALILAHSFYPAKCCNEGDCRAVPCEEIVVNGSWVTWRGLRTAAFIIKPSPDGECHVCNDYQRIRCIFMPEDVS